MIDTILVVWPCGELEPSLFDRVSINQSTDPDADGGKASKRYFNLLRGRGDAQPAEPRMTYYPSTRVGPRLYVEVSLPKFVGKPVAILSEVEVLEGLQKLERWVRGRGIDCAPIATAMCKRLDFCYAWRTGNLTSLYVAALERLQLARYNRVPFGPEGVVWKSGKGYRWVKFYDKKRELGYAGDALLRFEISTFKGALRDLAKRKYEISQTVGALVTRQVAYAELSYWLDALGVESSDFGARDKLDRDLVTKYGSRSAAQAKWALENYWRWNGDAYKEGQIKKSTFLGWVKKLRDDGFLVSVDQLAGLPPLRLPEFKDFGLKTLENEWLLL